MSAQGQGPPGGGSGDGQVGEAFYLTVFSIIIRVGLKKNAAHKTKTWKTSPEMGFFFLLRFFIVNHLVDT